MSVFEAKVTRMFRALLSAVASISLVAAGILLAPVAASAQGASLAAEAFGDESEDYSSSYLKPAPAQRQYSFGPKAFPTIMQGGPQPYIPPIIPRQVAFANDEPTGTILIDSGARRLYLTLSPDEVAVWPNWHPPVEMRLRDPRLAKKMLGGIKNPLGAVALYLGDTLYRIHGTNDPDTIGQAASSGCFRMLNGHAVHLARKVKIGTTVKVLPRLDKAPASAQLQGSTRSASAWKPTITR